MVAAAADAGGVGVGGAGEDAVGASFREPEEQSEEQGLEEETHLRVERLFSGPFLFRDKSASKGK